MLTRERVLDWLNERMDNCLRIASEKRGDDRDGWLEDAEYFRQIIRMLKES